MNRLVKVIGIIVLVVALLLVVGISLTIGWRPIIGPRARALTHRTFERTPARLARGQYLVDDLGCFDCHAQHDWKKHDAPIIPGTLGVGYDNYPSPGLPGRIVPSNITPDPEFGAGKWTDDQLARAIREGIGHDGRALFPLMPYPAFREISDEDLASVIVYLRSIPSIHKALPKTEMSFPVKYLIRSLPKPITQPVPQPNSADPVQYGKYLVDIAVCSDCHTPSTKNGPIPGMSFAGGVVLEGPWGKVASANITPDASGISYYDEALFIRAMRTGYVNARALNPVMAWWRIRNMTDSDLGAIFAYLKTLPPVKHRVDNTEAPALCRICGNVHGMGDRN